MRTKTGTPSTITRWFWLVSPAAIGSLRTSAPAHSGMAAMTWSMVGATV